MTRHGCPTSTWPWTRLHAAQCPNCGRWWIAMPVTLTRAGGWYPATRIAVWWARRRGCITTPAPAVVGAQIPRQRTNHDH